MIAAPYITFKMLYVDFSEHQIRPFSIVVEISVTEDTPPLTLPFIVFFFFQILVHITIKRYTSAIVIAVA
jgi:hypothetical protein